MTSTGVPPAEVPNGMNENGIRSVVLITPLAKDVPFAPLEMKDSILDFAGRPGQATDPAGRELRQSRWS